MYGLGLLKGMAVVLKNFVQSYYRPDRLTTVQYPEERRVLAPRTRTFPILIYDDSPEKLRCVACQLCAKACPVDCIRMTMARDGEGKPRKKPELYQVDLALCMSCGLCVEACPFGAMAMDQVFELAAYQRGPALIQDLEKLARPYSYLQQVNPEAAAEMPPKGDQP